MIISQDTLPEKNLYFIGGIIILILKISNNMNHMNHIEIYEEYLRLIKRKNLESVGYDIYYLALDWLYIIGAVDIDEETNTIYLKGK